jgi:HTH-type transcriptional regulator, sugar sensing transcriptional regulator
MNEEALEEVGFSRTEIKIYLALLQLGSSSAGPILEKTRLHNSVVHQNLHRLIGKGIVTYALEGKKKYYQAANPEHLLEYVDAKRKRVEELLPQLQEKKQFALKAPEATIYRGVRGVRELINSLLTPETKSYVSFGGSDKSNVILGSLFWKIFDKKIEERKIDTRCVFHNSYKWLGEQLKASKYIHIRYTDTAFEELTETFVVGSKVAIIIYLENPYGILIDDMRVATSYRKFFEILWKTARK